MGINGRGAPSYAYANNSPTFVVDADGRKINTTVTVLPEKYMNPTDCPGMPGCTQVSTSGKKLRVSECQDDRVTKRKKDYSCRGDRKGHWYFDVWWDVNIQSQYWDSTYPDRPSGDSEGLNIRQHEGLHQEDYTGAVAENIINPAIPTEGYDNFPDCDKARRAIVATLSEYIEKMSAYSEMGRDLHPPLH
jgi:hypothetical protein